MIYLDNGATSFEKPPQVRKAVLEAMMTCTNPGRGGYPAAQRATEAVHRCRVSAAEFFQCRPEQVVFTSNCTHGLNIAIRTLVKPGDRVVISGFEHNAVTRVLRNIGAQTEIAGRILFHWENTLEEFEDALRNKPKAAVFTHVSNVFGYIHPVEQMAALCRDKGIPFVVDAAQSAGILPVIASQWGADFIAMPGHKGLLGPQGTGILLCGRTPEPLLAGGTGSQSLLQSMPDDLPDRAEAGTLNVPGIAGLGAAIRYLQSIGIDQISRREIQQASVCALNLQQMGMRVFAGPHQTGTISFVPGCDCEQAAEMLAEQGIAVRAGLHCAPVAHESAGTLQTGTVRISFGHQANSLQTDALLQAVRSRIPGIR